MRKIGSRVYVASDVEIPAELERKIVQRAATRRWAVDPPSECPMCGESDWMLKATHGIYRWECVPCWGAQNGPEDFLF